jgi:hypothetical protein
VYQLTVKPVGALSWEKGVTQMTVGELVRKLLSLNNMDLRVVTPDLLDVAVTVAEALDSQWPNLVVISDVQALNCDIH